MLQRDRVCPQNLTPKFAMPQEPHALLVGLPSGVTPLLLHLPNANYLLVA